MTILISGLGRVRAPEQDEHCAKEVVESKEVLWQVDEVED